MSASYIGLESNHGFINGEVYVPKKPLKKQGSQPILTAYEGAKKANSFIQ
jgi:hypothetical protein